jgi:hypothetical protein
METEQNQSLPFSDVLVSRDLMAHLATRCIENLHARSEHRPAQKTMVLTTLIQCARMMCDADSLDVEIEHLKKTFRQNRYSNQDMKQDLHHEKKATIATVKAD